MPGPGALADRSRLILPGLWILGFLLETVLAAAALWLAGRHGPALAAIMINLAVALRFAVTLRPGHVPLITRYARCDRMGLPAEGEFYTRAVTAGWAALLGGFALLHAGALLDIWATASIARWQGAAVLLAFLGEHGLRYLLLPQLGLATPWRTFGAIWRCHAGRGAGHAA